MYYLAEEIVIVVPKSVSFKKRQQNPYHSLNAHEILKHRELQRQFSATFTNLTKAQYSFFPKAYEFQSRPKVLIFDPNHLREWECALKEDEGSASSLTTSPETPISNTVNVRTVCYLKAPPHVFDRFLNTALFQNTLLIY